MKSTLSLLILSAALATSCRTTQGPAGAPSVVAEAEPGTMVPDGLPQSIKAKSVPFKSLAGFVVSLKAGALGVGSSDQSAADAFSEQSRAFLKERHVAGKELFFSVIAVDASSALASTSSVNSKLATRNAASVEKFQEILGAADFSEGRLNSELLFYVNDSGKVYRQFFADTTTNVSVAVVNAAGQKQGTYKLPAQQEAAVAALRAVVEAGE